MTAGDWLAGLGPRRLAVAIWIAALLLAGIVALGSLPALLVLSLAYLGLYRRLEGMAADQAAQIAELGERIAELEARAKEAAGGMDELAAALRGAGYVLLVPVERRPEEVVH